MIPDEVTAMAKRFAKGGEAKDEAARAYDISVELAKYLEREVTRFSFAKSPLLETLREHATEIHKATGGQLPTDMQVEVHVHCGGMVSVRYLAACGDRLGKGIMDRRIELSDSPSVAAAKLIEALQRGRVAERIRVQFLRETAAELGFDIVAKAKGARR